jgi:hypothetical protein
MIHIEILSSSDPLAIGPYEFEYDYVLIGRSKKNDLIFLDKELPLSYLNLQVSNDGNDEFLVIKSKSRLPFFYINGKKVSGTLKVRIGDLIAFGENQLKIIDFKKTKPETDLTEAFVNFSKKAPELRFALDFIEEVLLELEEKDHNV